MALLQSVGQGLTFTALLIFAMSNSNPARGPVCDETGHWQSTITR
jgi:hypothetical protein